MTRPITRTCSNPLCRAPIEAGQAHAVELVQVWEDASRRHWHLCDPLCVRQYLALCALRDRVAACPHHPTTETARDVDEAV